MYKLNFIFNVVQQKRIKLIIKKIFKFKIKF